MQVEIRKKLEEVKGEVMERFRSLRDEVLIRLYYSETRESMIARELLKALSELSPLIKLEDRFSEDPTETPLIIITDDGEKYGERIKYLGLPVEYEFSTLIDTILRVSRKSVNLKSTTIKYLESLDKEVKIDVFVTPFCPFCPQMVKMAYQFAQVSDKVTARGIDAMMFENLSSRWNVLSVPYTVINERVSLVGAVSEDKIINKISEAVKEV